MPRTFDELLEIAETKKEKSASRKPIEETSRIPNSPWLKLATDLPTDDNDINFDVD